MGRAGRPALRPGGPRPGSRRCPATTRAPPPPGYGSAAGPAAVWPGWPARHPASRRPGRPGTPATAASGPVKAPVYWSAARVVVADSVLREPFRSAFGTVLEGLDRLVLRGDRRDLPGQFAAVEGPPVGRDVEHGDRPEATLGGRPGHAPGVPALLAGPGHVRPLPHKPHVIDPCPIAAPSQRVALVHAPRVRSPLTGPAPEWRGTDGCHSVPDRSVTLPPPSVGGRMAGPTDGADGEIRPQEAAGRGMFGG